MGISYEKKRVSEQAFWEIVFVWMRLQPICAEGEDYERGQQIGSRSTEEGAHKLSPAAMSLREYWIAHFLVLVLVFVFVFAPALVCWEQGKGASQGASLDCGDVIIIGGLPRVFVSARRCGFESLHYERSSAGNEGALRSPLIITIHILEGQSG